jgi:hypothetical protein
MKPKASILLTVISLLLPNWKHVFPGFSEIRHEGWRFSLVVECLHSMCEALGPTISSMGWGKKKRKRIGGRE